MLRLKNEYKFSWPVPNVKQEPEPLDRKPIKEEATETVYNDLVKWETKFPLGRRTYAIQRKRELRKAMSVYNNLITRDPDSLTNRETGSLTWAETTLVKNTLHRMRKKSGKPPSKDNAMIVREKSDVYQLAVFDFGRARRRYSLQEGMLVEKAFNKAVVDHVLSNPRGPIPTYGGVFWRDGMVMLDCRDKFSFDFATKVVQDLKPWRKAILRAVKHRLMLSVFKGSVVVPDVNLTESDVLKVLSSQNPLYDMKTWEVVDEIAHENDTIEYVLLLGEVPIRLVEDKGMNLFFGASEVYLKLLQLNDDGDGMSYSEEDA